MSQSSNESEYKALVDTTAELTSLQSLLSKLGIPLSKTLIYWCDKIGTTYLSANLVFYAQAKHIEIDFHFVGEKVARQAPTNRFLIYNYFLCYYSL